MKIFLWIVSMMWVVAGIMFIFAPAGMKKFYNWIVKAIRWTSLLALVFGLLFFWAAPASRLDWLMRILGVMALIKGVFILLFPINMVRATINWWLGLSSKTYRVYGILILLLAWLVISSIL